MSLKLVLSRFINPLIINNRKPVQTLIKRGFPSWGPPKPAADRKDIEFRVLKTLSLHDKIDSNSLKIESHLVEDLGLDSLDRIEITVQLEDEFAIEIGDQETDRLLTVKSIVDYLVEREEKRVDQNKCPDIQFKEGMVDRP